MHGVSFHAVALSTAHICCLGATTYVYTVAYLKPLLGSMQASNLHCCLNDSLQVKLCRRQNHFVCLYAAEVQDVRDEGEKRLPRAANCVHEIPLSR